MHTVYIGGQNRKPVPVIRVTQPVLPFLPSEDKVVHPHFLPCTTTYLICEAMLERFITAINRDQGEKTLDMNPFKLRPESCYEYSK